MESAVALRSFAALAHESRLVIYRYLVRVAPEGATAGALATAVGLPATTLSFHLKELNQAGLVEAKQEGRFVRYTARFDTVSELVRFLTEDCCGGDAGRCAPVQRAPRKPASRAAGARRGLRR